MNNIVTIKLSKSKTLPPTGSIQIALVPEQGNTDSKFQCPDCIQRSFRTLEQFSNECHSKVDGKFCKGPGGSAASASKTQKKEALKSRVAGSRKSTPALDKKEAELEAKEKEVLKIYKKAIESRDYRKANEIAPEANQIFRELHETRKQIYKPDDLERLNRAESVLDNLRSNRPTDKIGRDIVVGGLTHWEEEIGRAKKEARGQATPKLTQKLGTTIDTKKGEWPDDKATRPITQTTKAGLIGSKEVDGIKVKSAYEITAKDGVKIQMYDLTGKKPITNHDDLLQTTAKLHELYPHKPPKKLVILNESQARAMCGPNTNAFVYPNTDYIFLNKSLVNKVNSSGDWMMPSSKKVSSAEYVVTHEYGHQYDFSNKRSSARGMFETPQVKKQLSKYGNSVAEEGYAEAFAEWHASKGQTQNPAAVAYARHEKWYGNDRVVRSVEGAKLYGVSIGQKIPTTTEASTIRPDSWDPWAIAAAMGVITMAIASEKKEIEVSKLKVPVVAENWAKGPKLINFKPAKATEVEKKEAGKIAREVWTELGLEWEE